MSAIIQPIVVASFAHPAYSVQKPVELATQRNEEAIKAWKEECWPALKKKPSRNSDRSFL
ncbi:hypothetical protein KSD_06160 [Ktedonobacter sp. SOSP1-85]|uniref:winged helix-turn-helix domain-containing protein n=1 Tax=Ktedonobacter sp. SOSP1-85 TaxID=2778367 RepID=UPI001A34D0B5|nr:winged helix-turn-helix domain-containing protein [Ktedonobacter sp. SOSP1-85]GHO72833.1 hypothetical protein KSD_06040 [Ktedonobacter sp. SOSP1-85]GHO72845.1 hypothetical protein KSD_06160 [Ktedonobacter sp. SOSP1-85]